MPLWDAEFMYSGGFLFCSGAAVRALLLVPVAYFDLALHRITAVAKEAMPALATLRAVAESAYSTKIEKALAYDAYRKTLRELRAKHAVSYSRTLLSMTALPLALYSMYYVRSALKDSTASTEKPFAWVPSLAEADPYCAFPLIAEGLFALQANLSFALLCRREPLQFSQYLVRFRLASCVLTLAAFPLICNAPAGVFVYCIGMGTVGLMQPLAVRRWLQQRL